MAEVNSTLADSCTNSRGFRLFWIHGQTVDIQQVLHCFGTVAQHGCSFKVVKYNILYLYRCLLLYFEYE